MDKLAKKRIKEFLDKAFTVVKNSKIYQNIKKLHITIRIIIFLFCVSWFFIGTILMPPIPLGNVALVCGFVIIFPIKKVKSKTNYIINKLRVKKFYAKRLEFKHKFKSFTTNF